MTKRSKVNIENAKKFAKSKSGKCLSNKCTYAKDYLKWECREKHRWLATYDSVKCGSWCGQCAGTNKLSLNLAKQVAKNNSGRCLSTKYINSKSPLYWICKKDHRWYQNLSAVRSGTWCAKCHAPGTGQTIKDMRKLAKLRGGKCLSKTYVTARKKLLWQCRLDHESWQATPDEIKRGRWCPQCQEGLGERICRAYFCAAFLTTFDKVRPKFLLNEKTGVSFELDGYSPNLKLAFEHHGRQHYKTNSYFSKTKSGLKQRKNTDLIKLKMCHKAGIKIIEIPSVPDILPLSKFDDYLTIEFKRLKIKPKKQIRVSNLNLAKAFSPDYNSRLREMKKIAIKRGGKCLSKLYLGYHGKLLWKCKFKHLSWEASPAKIHAGRWCPECSGRKKKDLLFAQKLAKSFGAKLLSKKYVNGKSKLRWQCEFNHKWSASLGSLHNVGSGCPHCFNLRRSSSFQGPRPKRPIGTKLVVK